MLAQARENAEPAQHLQHFRRPSDVAEVAAVEKFLVYFRFLAGAQAIRHLDDANAVEEGFVVLVVLEQDIQKFAAR